MTPETFKTSASFIVLDSKHLAHAELAIAFKCSLRMMQRYLYSEADITPEIKDKLAYILRAGLLPGVAKEIRERRASDGRRKS
jgi:hypothetical protein